MSQTVKESSKTTEIQVSDQTITTTLRSTAAAPGTLRLQSLDTSPVTYTSYNQSFNAQVVNPYAVTASARALPATVMPASFSLPSAAVVTAENRLVPAPAYPMVATAPSYPAVATAPSYPVVATAPSYPVVATAPSYPLVAHAPAAVTATQAVVTKELVPVPVPVPVGRPEPMVTEVHISDERPPNEQWLQSVIKSLQSQLERARAHEAELQAIVDSFEARMKTWGFRKSQLTSLQAEIERLQDALLEAKHRLLLAQQYRETAEAEVARLEEMLAEALERGKQVEVLQQDLLALQQQLAAAQERILAMEIERDATQLQLAALNAQLVESNEALWKARSEFDAERSQLKTENAALLQRIQALEGERDRAQNESKFYKGLLLEADERMNQLQATFDSERSKLQGRLAELESERDRLRNEATSWENRFKEADQQLTAARAQISQMQMSFDSERSKLQGAVAGLEAERDRLRAEVASWETRYRDVEQQLASVRQELFQLQINFDSERSRLQGTISQLEAERDRLKSDSASWESRFRDADQQLAAARQQIFQMQMSFDSDRTKLQGTISGLEAERDRLRNEIASWESRFRDVDQQLAGARQQIAQLERERADAQHEVSMYELKLRNANDQLQAGNDRLAQLQKEWEAERAQLQEQLATLQTRFRTLERELEGARSEIKSWELRFQEVTEQLNAANQRGNKSQAAWESERAEFQAQLFKLQSRLEAIEKERDAARKEASFLEMRLREADQELAAAYKRIAELEARIAALELEIRNLRAQLQAKVEIHSQTNIKETYKVKTFEMAAKLAVMDGTDDGMFNGLPIEVEGEGLYRDLVAAGRKPRPEAPNSSTVTTSTYKVQTFEMAERLSKMDGTDDGKYNDLPIEVIGEGLYTDLVRAGRRSTPGSSGRAGSLTRAAGASTVSTSGATTGGETYIVTSMEIAATLSKMNPADNGTYKGLPIEVKGRGLYRDLRGAR